jgi:phage terminase small subunit
MAKTATKTDNPPDIPRVKQKQIGKTKRELSARARTIIQAIIDGASETQALKKAGYSDSYVQAGKSTILNNPRMQEAFTRVLERAGVTDDRIADRLNSLIDAKTLKQFGKDTKEIDDNGTQLGAVQLAAKLRGHLVERSVSVNVGVDLSPVDLERWKNE